MNTVQMWVQHIIVNVPIWTLPTGSSGIPDHHQYITRAGTYKIHPFRNGGFIMMVFLYR